MAIEANTPRPLDPRVFAIDRPGLHAPLRGDDFFSQRKFDLGSTVRSEHTFRMNVEQAARLRLFTDLQPLAAGVFVTSADRRKRTILGLAGLSLLLGACTPAVLPTPTPREISLAPTPTNVAATETAVPTPTEAGPKAGDKLVENGYTYTYTVIPESGYKGWFRPMAEIPLVPWDIKYVPDGKGGYVESNASNDVGPTRLLIEKGLNGEQIISALTQTRKEKGSSPLPNYTEQLLTYLRKDYSVTHPNANDYQFNTDLQRGNVTYTFHVGPTEYTWTISPKSGATIYVLKNDPAYLTEENGFWTWVDGPYGTHFYTAFWGVDNNGIVGAISVDKSLDQLDPFELRILPLYHQVAVLTHDDVQGVACDANCQRMVIFAGEGNPPVIDVKKKE